jgi:hypothetical protein
MHKALYILVAVHTTEHAAVDGVLQLVFIDVDADLLAVHFLGQRCVGVAGKAIGVFELLTRACCKGPNQKQKRKDTGGSISNFFHA